MNDAKILKSAFTFREARVAVLPPLGWKIMDGKDVAFNTAVLEVLVPQWHGEPKPSLVEVEAWGKAAKVLSCICAGDVVNASGLVLGRAWRSPEGRQRYITTLRLVELEVVRKAEVKPVEKSLEEEFGF